MIVEATRLITSEIDPTGVPMDALWRIRTPGSPVRVVRLFGGSESLRSLLHKYSFNDANGCSFSEDPDVNLRRNARDNAARVGVDLTHVVLPSTARGVRRMYSRRLPPLASAGAAAAALVVGVPQRSPESGICWWSALCFACMRPPAMREAFLELMQASERGADMVPLWSECLQDVRVAETLRHRVYHELGLGDQPGIAAREEGQNGYTQLSLVASKLGIPMMTLMLVDDKMLPVDIEFADAHGVPVPCARPPKDMEPAILGVRVHRAHYKPPLVRKHAGRTYHLQSCLIGSEWCTHQCSLARGDGGWWHYMDADAGRLRIGPFSFRLDDERFWEDLMHVLPYSNVTESSRFCDMAPHNRSPMKVHLDAMRAVGAKVHDSVAEKAMNAPDTRLVNVDWIYVAR